MGEMKEVYRIIQEEPYNLFTYLKAVTKKDDCTVIKLAKKFKADYKKGEKTMFKHMIKVSTKK